MSNDPKTPTHSVTTRTVRAALDTDTSSAPSCRRST